MKIDVDNDYGSDIDGNRGTKVVKVVFEDTQEEREEIAEILYNKFKNQDNMTYINFNGIYVDIDLNDYKEEFINIANKDENLDFEDKKYLEEEYNLKINNPFLNKYEISFDKSNNSENNPNMVSFSSDYYEVDNIKIDKTYIPIIIRNYMNWMIQNKELPEINYMDTDEFLKLPSNKIDHVLYHAELYNNPVLKEFFNKLNVEKENKDNNVDRWNIKIGDISISDDVFQKMKTNYDCVDVKSAIEDLEDFINEKLNKSGLFIIDSEKKEFFEEIIDDNNPNNEELIMMIKTLKKLKNSEDDFCMKSISDRTDVIFPSTDFEKFKKCCDDILKENKKIQNKEINKNLNKDISI